ncbi:Hint domain-containing protein [Halocynthiibacter sp. C4]|uniref:Hint domain-containing protein n=1 Tax=Halocynthiibacter sp. C4 TaxID=2992758 RepID=UPI00237A2E90|nr:Hint domain-containing protein [Halocynthiibacter sp. C4]MDE0588846.1 Hint domain-containing protein [Halocynthiibacter sp. C4]
MGYNITEVSGNAVGSGLGNVAEWTFDVQKSDLLVTGDFDLDAGGLGSGGAEPDEYFISDLSTTAYGTPTIDANGILTFDFSAHTAAIVANGGAVITFTVTGYSYNDPNDPDDDEFDADLVTINIAICVQRGTEIQTKGGLTLVEDLEVGDLVQTVDSGLKPVKWIGSRTLNGTDLEHLPELRPIRISAGALGDNTPTSDLLVSPQHRVLLSSSKAELFFGESEILVSAKSLVNDTDIRVASDIDDVEYFHVLFDRHEIMLTNGAATESFFPGDYVLDTLNAGTVAELEALFPELMQNPEGFGPPARLPLKGFEGSLLRETEQSDVKKAASQS